MPYNSTRALQLLRFGTQNPAAFRDGQEAAIQQVVDGRGRLLVVQKTGWGKSSVYFIATKLLREEGMGPAILIPPTAAARCILWPWHRPPTLTNDRTTHTDHAGHPAAHCAPRCRTRRDVARSAQSWRIQPTRPHSSREAEAARRLNRAGRT